MLRLSILVLALALTACRGEPPRQWSSAPAMRIDIGKQYVASLETDRGAIQVDLLPREAPNTVNNFVFLAREGFYDGVPFHRIIKGFMLQTGDPSGTGRGGPGYRIIDEPVTLNYDRGAVAMANSGAANTGGSQFFIIHGENVFLPKTYTIFGKVSGGFDVLDAIASVPVTASPQGEPSVPQEIVKIQRVRIDEQ
jgi:cyclophilin family peptidyl-prolyl cis-trans isomerase